MRIFGLLYKTSRERHEKKAQSRKTKSKRDLVYKRLKSQIINVAESRSLFYLYSLVVAVEDVKVAVIGSFLVQKL